MLPLEQSNDFVVTYGSIPTEILTSQDYFTWFTNMFLHGGWMHLIGNMMFLWVFADNIEATIGNFKFLTFYVLGGLAASAAHIFFKYLDNNNQALPTCSFCIILRLVLSMVAMATSFWAFLD